MTPLARVYRRFMTATQPDDWPPTACTLPTTERPLRVAEFDDLFAAAVRGVDRRDPTSLILTLADAPGRAELVRDLTARETDCCSFFAFQLTDGDPLRLEISVPPAHRDVLDALADRASRTAGGAT
jgi:hypothetical protein